eukprot:COSAG03_NODE_31905_length_144_cov_69.200000_1_plen_27_part_01
MVHVYDSAPRGGDELEMSRRGSQSALC